MDNVEEFLKGERGNAPHGHPDHVCSPFPALAVMFLPTKTGFEVHLHGFDVPKERLADLLRLAADAWEHGGMLNPKTGAIVLPGELTDDR